MMMTTNPWFVFPTTAAPTAIRLFCFPYAGGGTAVYNSWARHFPDTIELCSVRLPGRESRLGERPFTQLNTLMPKLLAAITPCLERPFAFLGHSMGALLAFELTRRLRQANLPLPTKLFVSGFRAPQLPDTRLPLRHLSDADFIHGVQQLGGLPEAVAAHAELMALLLPMLRADFTLVETYRYVAERPLALPITAIGGTQDPLATPAQLEDWAAQTTAVFRTHILPGDHFFIHSQAEQMRQLIQAEL